MTDSAQFIARNAMAAAQPSSDSRRAPHGGGNVMVPAPRWAAIESILLQRIASGVHAAGSQLPPAHTLAKEFAVNRHTIRQAVASLAARGLVRVAQGHGTFVQGHALEYVLGTRTRLSENLQAMGAEGGHRMLESSLTPATAAMSAKLGVAPGGPLLRITTLAEAGGLAISTGEHYFPADRFTGLDQAFAQTGSITRALAQFGVVDYTRRENIITARLPERTVAARLRQPCARPVLFVESVNVDMTGTAIEYGRAWFAGDLVQLQVTPGR
jgi:GntR family phosphonate transport system transcriptional regulator